VFSRIGTAFFLRTVTAPPTTIHTPFGIRANGLIYAHSFSSSVYVMNADELLSDKTDGRPGRHFRLAVLAASERRSVRFPNTRMGFRPPPISRPVACVYFGIRNEFSRSTPPSAAHEPGNETYLTIPKITTKAAPWTLPIGATYPRSSR